MAFDNGSLSFCVYRLDEDLPEDHLELFAEHAALPLKQVKNEPSSGWSARHLLETEFTPATCYIEDFLQVHFRTSERKVATPLLKARCAQVEFQIMGEEQLSGLNRKRKKEIRENIMDELMVDAQPTIKGFPLVFDPENKLLYVGTSSTKAADEAIGLLIESTGISPIPYSPQTCLAEALGASHTNYDPIVISDSGDMPEETWVGRDFLTWIWHFCEYEDAEFTVPDLGVFHVSLDGPINLISETNGARESVVRKGIPTLSPEAHSALCDGKKLKSAKVAIARGDDIWSFTLDADTFCFKSMKLPDGTEFQYAPHFNERVESLNVFQAAFFGLFNQFVERFGGEAREENLNNMKEWLKERETSVYVTDTIGG